MKRVVIVSHASVNEPHRRPYDALAADPDFEVHLVTPESIPVGSGRRKECDPPPRDSRYVLHKVSMRFEHSGRFIWFIGLRRVIREVSPDIVFIEQDPGSVAVLQAAVFAPRAERVAFSVENILRDRFRDALANARTGRLKEAARDAAVGLLASAGAKVTDSLACISLEGADLFKKGLAWSKPISVMPLGTDTERFRPLDVSELRQTLGLSNAFVVGYFGRLVPEKGVHLLIEALPSMPSGTMLLLDMFKNFEPGSYAASILARAEALGLSDRVVTIDVPHSEIPRYMNCCDTVVLPSLTSERWKEQFGRVLPEAMACGVPVVGSRSGNIPDMIGTAGLLVTESSSEEIARAVGALAADPVLRRRLGIEGRARVKERFSIEAQVRQMRALFLREPNSQKTSTSIN